MYFREKLVEYRVFLSLWNDFSTEQYVLGLVDGCISFFDKGEKYLCLNASMETPSKS